MAPVSAPSEVVQYIIPTATTLAPTALAPGDAAPARTIGGDVVNRVQVYNRATAYARTEPPVVQHFQANAPVETGSITYTGHATNTEPAALPSDAAPQLRVSLSDSSEPQCNRWQIRGQA